MSRHFSQFVLGILCIFLAAGPCAVGATHYGDESSLRTALLTGYEYKIRPDTKVTADVRLSLLNINHLNVPDQRLSVSGWLTVRWQDSRLTWTPATYGNIADFYDTELVLWRPELIVDNSVTNLGILESDKLLIRVKSSGEMVWEPTSIFETHCDVDVTYYPFDTQLCIVEVTSWSHTLEEVDLAATDTEVYLADFEESGEWDVLTSWTERRILLDGTDQHAQLDFYMKLRRKPSYYVLTILIPVIVTSILCVVVFLLPAESGEKVGFSLTILLTYTVMLTLVASYMPPTSKTTSILSVYLTIILFVGVFSTLLTVMVLYCYHQPDGREVPAWLQRLTHTVLVRVARRTLGHAPSTPTTNGKLSTNDEQTNGVSWTGSQLRNKIQPSDKSNSTAGTFQSYDVKGGLTVNDKASRPGSSTLLVDLVDYSWQEISILLDSTCLRILSTVVALLTVVVILALLVGGYTV